MTQKEVGEELGVARRTVSDLENIGGNKGDNVPIKSATTPPPTKPAYGNSKAGTNLYIPGMARAVQVCPSLVSSGGGEGFYLRGSGQVAQPAPLIWGGEWWIWWICGAVVGITGQAWDKSANCYL